MVLCSDYNLKLLLIGNSNVGKSCLLLRFSVPLATPRKTSSNPSCSTPLASISYLPIHSENQDGHSQRREGQARPRKIWLTQWDTAGQERFRTITNSYYRNANGIIIVYDITDRESFDNVAHWYD